MDAPDTFSPIWAAFEDARMLPACAWCERVCIDGIWVVPSRAALVAIDRRYTFSHTICELCARSAPTREGD
jgi:hypothetical protein